MKINSHIARCKFKNLIYSWIKMFHEKKPSIRTTLTSFEFFAAVGNFEVSISQ